MDSTSTTINQLAKKFISNPENFTLFRGENEVNQGGLHFTTDKEWAKKFGKIILSGQLPSRCKFKMISEDDFELAFNVGISSEGKLWTLLFKEGYDAVIGYDPMNSHMLDVVVNPVHLDRFKPLND